MNVKDNLVNIIRIDNIDYISLTDLARYKNQFSDFLLEILNLLHIKYAVQANLILFET